VKQFRLLIGLLLTIILAIFPLCTAFADTPPPEKTVILPENITLSETSVTKYVGDEFSVTVKIAPDNATETAIAWTSSDAKVATVSPEGKIVCVGTGNATISAATVNGKKASCALRVSGVDAKGVALNAKAMTIGVNETKALTATLDPFNTTNKSLKWSSSDKKIAKVSKSGSVTGVKKGTAVITVTTCNGKKAACKVKVKEIPVTSVKMSKSSHKGKTGESFNLKAEILPVNASYKKIKWSSSNEKVAKVSSKGVVKLFGPGKAAITATACNKKKTVCKVTSVSRFDSVHYRQSDSKWKFSRRVRKTACMISSFAIMLENADIHATPRTVYNVSRSTCPDYDRICKKFGVKTVNALAGKSPYLKKFNGYETYIKNPSKNYVKAVKEALKRNPEGVCVYFKRGSRAHMIVAIGYIGNTIYYSDPGRMKEKGFEVAFSSTWVAYKHRMKYKNVMYLVAIDVK